MPQGADGAVTQIAASPAAPLAPTATMLSEGGDHRIRTDGPDGVNRYGCPPDPDETLIAFGSSTASTISAPALAAAERLRGRLTDSLARAPAAVVYERELDRVRAELLGLCGLADAGVEVLLAPSGTDLHMLAAQLIGSDPANPTLAIIAEETETGSGVPAALAGRPYSPLAPFGAVADDGEPITGVPAAEVASVSARAADGSLRDQDIVDAEVEALASDAATSGRRVLLVLTDVSKTGLITPSASVAQRLAARWPDQVMVLVDGSQMRLSARALQTYAAAGWLIAVTGSKFLTGPAFSAALFIPPRLSGTLGRRVLSPRLRAFSARAEWPHGWTARAQLEPAANFGLLLRWEAALEELRRFRAAPEAQVRAIAAQFGRSVTDAMAAHPSLEALAGRDPVREPTAEDSWDSRATIFPFLMRGDTSAWLSREQTARVYRLLREDLSQAAAGCADSGVRAAAGLRIDVGQPVPVGARDGTPVSALRLGLSARLIADVCSGGPGAAAKLLLNCRQALTKAAWLAGEVSAGRL